MAGQEQSAAAVFDRNLRTGTIALVLAVMFATTVMAAPAAQAQTFKVIHSFTGGASGSDPGELTIDRAGNLYGSASGGTGGAGFVFEMKHTSNGWIFVPIYTFQGQSDGAGPGIVVIGPDGALYGATLGGGTTGSGTIFRLAPQASFCRTVLCPWVKTTLYNFTGAFDDTDGVEPVGGVVFGPDGSIYGVTSRGGINNYGTAYKLARSNGGWTESVLHTFGTGTDGIYPDDGLVLDQAGNLYGVTFGGGPGEEGTAFELSPSGSGWTESIIYDFGHGNGGTFPAGGLIFDPSGNLLGTTTSGPGSDGGGTVFQLTPSSGSWTQSVLYDFNPGYGGGPYARLNMDATGTLYGTTENVPSAGAVFKLAPKNGYWVETNLYVFRDGGDGGHPFSNVVFDASGNLYGTAIEGGGGYCQGDGCGVIWQITP